MYVVGACGVKYGYVKLTCEHTTPEASLATFIEEITALI